MARCRAPVFVEANKPLKLREFEIPNLGKEELLVEMKIAGICGTDVHMWHDARTEAPMIFGHENVGIVKKLGARKRFDAVGQSIHEGDWVVFGGVVPCGECYACIVAKEPTVCERGLHYGTSPIRESPYLRGGYAEYVHLVKGAGIVKFPGKKYMAKAMLAVIGNRTLIHGFEKMGGIQAGDTVVVQGSGPIGLAAVVQSKLAGAGQIIVLGAPKPRLRLAREVGGDVTINIVEVKKAEERVMMVKSMTEGRGADVVIEASGGSTAVAEGVEMTRIGGKYLVIGQATDYGPRPINPFYITKNQLKIYGSWAAMPIHLFKAIRSLKNLDLPIDKLITHRFGVEEATEGLRTVSRLESVIAVIQHS